MTRAAPALEVAPPTANYQWVALVAVASATLSVMVVARSLLFADDAGTLIVALTIAGFWFSARVQRAGVDSVSPGFRRMANGAVVLLALVCEWGYLVQSGVVGGWFDWRGLNVFRISVFESVRMLLMGILWLVALRSFTLFSQRDLMLTLVPAMSMLLLVCVLDSEGQATFFVAWFAVSSWLALAADHKLRSISRRRVATRARVGEVIGEEIRTSLSHVGVVLLVALGLTAMMNQWSRPGSQLQGASVQLAWLLARYMVDFSRHTPSTFAGPLAVGAPAPPMGNQVVLRVTSEVPGYWRGRCYEEFDGSFWRDTRVRNLRHNIESTRPSVDRVFQFPLAARPGAQWLEVGQTYEVQSVQMGTLLSLGAPVEARARLDIRKPLLRLDLHSSIACSKPFTPGERYFVRSLVARHDARVLPSQEPLSAATTRACLDVGQVTARTRLLAERVTKGRTSNDGKAEAIARYLTRTYSYSLAMAPYPRGRDGVDFFLFEARTGYCIQFASAMVIMCRAVGVPARLAAGYATGEPGAHAGEYVVRETDAHAWPEVYLGGDRWMRFEPTPGILLRSSSGLNLLRAASDFTRALSRALLRLLPIEAMRHWRGPTVVFGFALMLPVALGLLRILVRSRTSTRRARTRFHPEHQESWARLLRELKHRFRARDSAETFGEYLRSCKAKTGMDLDGEAVAGAYNCLLYAAQPATPGDLRRANTLAGTTHRRIRRRGFIARVMGK